MASLWTPRDDFLTFNSTEHSIAESCGTRAMLFLPYRRKYTYLGSLQLVELIHEAQKYHWHALDLSNCGINDLPDELWTLTDLRILYLGNPPYLYDEMGTLSRYTGDHPNTFSFIPKKIEQLRNLEVLSLSHLPCSIEGDRPLNLPKLHHLDIFDCGFHQIPNALLIPSIEAIGFNCLDESLSDNITNLKKLRSAFLTRSKFKTLPNNFCNLKNLEYLY